MVLSSVPTEARLTVSPPSPAHSAPSAMATSSSLWPVLNEGKQLTATVVELGTGSPPVVFLHGLVGLNEHWEGVVHRVSHAVKCTLFGLPLLKLRGGDCSIQG